MSIEDDYLIVGRGGAAYVGSLDHGIKPPVSIHVDRWYVIVCLFQWDVVVEILVLLLGLVNNDGCDVALPIRSGRENHGAPEWCALSSLHLSHPFPLKVLVSTHNLAPFNVGFQPNFIAVPHLSSSWLELIEVEWDSCSYLQRKFVLMIFISFYCCSANLVDVFLIWHDG